MSKLLSELRERLLSAGVAPRHVRRYVNELADHYADLRAEEERAGRTPADAEAAALNRLGGIDDLSGAMIQQRQLQSWCVRAPWAMFGLAPLFLLAGSYFFACLVLWSGWQLFLPGTTTPFVKVHGLASVYFGIGRWAYYGSPVLIGWGIGFIAARQRCKAIWPAVGLILIAWIGGTAQVHASRQDVPGGAGHVSMDFALGPSMQGMADGLFHSFVILLLMLLPSLLWRFQKIRGN